MKNRIAAIILAAGLGTRMKSDKAKVLHTICGQPMILYVVETAVKIASQVVLVVGHQAEAVKIAVSENQNVWFAMQEEKNGTAHAVECGLPALKPKIETVIILCGDVPMLSTSTLKHLVQYHFNEKNDISLLSVNLPDPTGYGRVVCDTYGKFIKIKEEAEATFEEKKIKEVNSGVYCVQVEVLSSIIPKIEAENNQKERYLTDIIEIGQNMNKKIGKIITANTNEVIGINTCEDLKQVEFMFKSQI
jgi:bifunctional UDP-N-acetylglucosamine pyrophosphorylase/glucosamine-1-phosphate N-acetyltransferase/UDP-N-acetylglucosamine pyrophosphorylase